MFASEIRRAVEVSSRAGLPAIGEAMWKAWAAGQVTDAEAEELSALIEARKVMPPASPPGAAASSRRRFGSRPRSDASLGRRRRCVAPKHLPPALATHFTQAETAVLAMVAEEVIKRGDCRLAVGHLAALAGVSESTVRNALRRAKTLGLVTVEERRLTAFRNSTNVVCIISHEWASWLKLGTNRAARMVRAAPNQTRLNRHRSEFDRSQALAAEGRYPPACSSARAL